MSLRILSSNTRGLTGFAGLLTHPCTSAFPMSCSRFLEFRIYSLRFLSTFNHHPSTIIPDRASVAIDSMCNTRAHSSGTVQDSHLIPFSSVARKRGIRNKTEGKISARRAKKQVFTCIFPSRSLISSCDSKIKILQLTHERTRTKLAWVLTASEKEESVAKPSGEQNNSNHFLSRRLQIPIIPMPSPSLATPWQKRHFHNNSH